MEKDGQENRKSSVGGLVVAFLTGAGVGATAFLLASKARRGWKPSTDAILKKCDKAFQALDTQISEFVA